MERPLVEGGVTWEEVVEVCLFFSFLPFLPLLNLLQLYLEDSLGGCNASAVLHCLLRFCRRSPTTLRISSWRKVGREVTEQVAVEGGIEILELTVCGRFSSPLLLFFSLLSLNAVLASLASLCSFPVLSFLAPRSSLLAASSVPLSFPPPALNGRRLIVDLRASRLLAEEPSPLLPPPPLSSLPVCCELRVFFV